MEKLKLEPDQPSKTIVVTANGSRARALGQISDLRIFIQDMIIPVKLQVIKSCEETLLLGTDWFEKMKAKCDFDKRTLQICYQDKCIKIGTTHLADVPPQLPIDDSDKEQILEEIEFESEDDLSEQEAYTSDILPEEENPAIFLSDQPKDLEIEPKQGVLTPEQKEKLDDILEENQDIFAERISREEQTGQLGRTNVVTHTIDT